MTRPFVPAALAAALVLGLCAPAFAKRPNALELSCRAVKAAVDKAGARVITTGPMTYDRFVSDSRFCERTQYTQPAWIESADEPECFVGYTCREYMRDDW